MVNYSNGKIYKIEPIVEHEEGDIYIGSTTKLYLSQRMDSHRSCYKQWKKGVQKYTTSHLLFEKYGIENCNILLIESVNANSKDELHARENHYIKSLKCVNKNIPSRTNKEYRNDNKERLKIKTQEYRDNHKERIKIKIQEYRDNHKEEIKIRDKKYREANLDKIHALNNKKTDCPCGGSYTHCHKALHLRTLKHQNYIKSLNDIEIPNES